MHPEHLLELGPLPADVDAFLAVRDRVATTPFGGAATLALAMLAWSQDPARGLPWLAAAIDASHLVDGPDGLQGRQPSPAVLRNLRDRLGDKPHVVRSYFVGTSPEAGYALPPTLAVRVREQIRDVGPEEAKVFVWSSGADTPRPMRLRRSPRGWWKAVEWSSLEVGIRAPAAPAPVDL